MRYHEPDWRWVQGKCLEFCRHPDPDLCGLAVTCFGHLARIHRKLDLDLVMPVLRELSSDEDGEIGGRVQDALDDIEMFLSSQ